MATTASIFKKIRKICLAFPESVETETWGKPHFRVNDKIFAGCGEEDGKIVLGCKLEMDHAKAIIKTPGFSKAPYVGHKGWISIDATDISDWDFVAELIEESYRLIAPKKLVDQLNGKTDAFQSAKKSRAKKIRKKK